MTCSVQQWRRVNRSAAGRTETVCVLAAFMVLASGCAAIRKPKVVPDSVTTCRQLSCEGVAAMQRGQLDEARQLLTKAVLMSPGDIDARRQLAEVLYQSGELQQAAVHLEAAVRLDPQHAPTVVRSGEMLLGLGAVDRALARGEEAIVLDSKLSGAWALRGRVYRQLGDYERSLADVHQALRYSPNDASLLQEVAEMQYQLDRPHRCLTTLQHLLSTMPPDQQPQQALWLEGLAYGKVNRHDEAAACLYAASLKGPAPPDLLYQLAQAQEAAGRTQEAKAAARQAIAAGGQHEASQALLARLEGAGPAGMESTLRR